jgi:hypothetical protein
MGGGHTLFMFFPFLFIGGGLAFISFAAGDKKQKQDRKVHVLPVGAQHPLSHVRHKMRPEKPGSAQQSRDGGAQVRPLKRY